MTNITEQKVCQALQEMLRDNELKQCLEIETGEVLYYLPAIEDTIDWTKFNKLQ